MDDVTSVTKAIWIYQFNSVTENFEEGSGDYLGLDSDDEDLGEEGSGYGEVSMDVQVVADSDHVVTEYGGTGAVTACAVSLAQTRDNVVFVVTGGLSQEGVTLDRVMRL